MSYEFPFSVTIGMDLIPIADHSICDWVIENVGEEEQDWMVRRRRKWDEPSRNLIHMTEFLFRSETAALLFRIKYHGIVR